MSRSLTVLLVEDDVWLSEQFSRALHSVGYTVQSAVNGQVAMDMISDVMPDVLVVDMLLTGGTVLTLLHELQSYQDTAHIPIVLCTNMAAQVTLPDIAPYGVKRILDKTTMLPEDLIAAVRSVML